ncbi:MAG: diguanylate cyclase [Gammaproteobacteria bacterium]|nr:MAG: diguanylate cyclase [Gammaproteobacteria bacterium]
MFVKMLSAKQRIVIAVAIYVLWVIGFAYFNFLQEKQHLYASLDQQLETAAVTTPLLLPTGLHHKEMSEDDLTPKQDYNNTLKLSEYTDKTDIIYIYTLILRNDKIFFTTSSATPEERETGEGLTSFLDHYDDVDPRVYDIFNSGSKGFLEYSDQWGTFRSVFIPQFSKDGTFYLSAADLSIAHIQTSLNQQLIYSLTIAGFFLLFIYPIYRVSINSFRTTATDLENEVQKRTLDLKLSAERHKLAMKAANQGWYDLNLQTGKFLVSDSYSQLFGFEPSEFPTSSMEWQKSIHPDDKEFVLKANKQHLETHEPFEIDYRWQAKDGRWVWIHSVGEIIEWDKNDRPLRMIGVHTDITERKHSEEVLRVLAESGTSNEGNIFEIIVRQLALSQNVRHALIAAVNSDDSSMADTLAISSDGAIIDNFSYLLKGTPCENVLKEGSCIYPDSIQKLFPDDHLLVNMSAQCYVGVSLKNSQDEVVGLLALIDDKPMSEHSHPMTLLNSLASRASIELERTISNEKLELSARVFTDTHEGISITDAAGKFIDVNPAFCTITGYSREEVIGKNSSILNSGKHSSHFFENIKKALREQGHWQGEIWNRKKNGELFAEMLTISSLKNAKGKTLNYIGLFTDITESKQQQQKLELMAHYDTLTQLPNRSLFADRFAQAVAHSRRSESMLAICFLDLDDFKPVNDNYGHDVGDMLLIEVAKRIKATIREEDTVSRQGGDEFALLLGDIDSFAQCEQLLVRVHHALVQPYLIDGYPHKISASSGITLYPLDDSDLDTLLRHADQSMYQAKLAGKNRYRLFNALDDQYTIKKHNQLQEIEHALLNNEFVLFYQPKVNMKTGVAFGAEALIRWIHPEKGLIPPLEFLPVIDGSDLEIKIGGWVINEALKQLEKWRLQGIHLEVSINISSHHLQSASFLGELENAMSTYPKVDSQHLQLEILESSALSNINHISNIIKACRSTLGINVALDDFGTGYSSLTHLKNLSAGTIKIDRTFVRDILDDPNDYAIIDGVIGLADSFNRKIIAEGVETDIQGLMLLIMGCYEAQGFGIAKPMPTDDIPAWLNDYIPNEKWISYGNQERTLHEKKIELFKITSNQWISRFITNIQSSPEDVELWPIMANTKCHCGSWIRKARQEHLFKQNWLDKLNAVHDEVHHIAYELLLSYQEGEVETARNGLDKLQIVSGKMNKLLDQYDD